MNRMNRSTLMLASAMLLCGEIAFGQESAPGRYLITFDDCAASTIPKGWVVGATNPKGALADWAVVDDAATTNRILAVTKINQTYTGIYNLCWTPAIQFRDGEIEVRARADSGQEDQGGGPMWRVADASNYYIARYNPLERNFRVYVVKDGKRTQLADARAEINAGQWFVVKIIHQGENIHCSLNGKPLLEAKDSSLPNAGGMGLWTKADAMTSFDNLSVALK